VSSSASPRTEKASAAIPLTKGRHSVRLEYFEHKNLATLIASWQSAGVGKQVIPASAWGH
jgi:hypothetical protein